MNAREMEYKSEFEHEIKRLRELNNQAIADSREHLEFELVNVRARLAASDWVLRERFNEMIK